MLRFIGAMFFLAMHLSSCSTNAHLRRDKSAAALYNTQLGLLYFNKGERPRAKKKLLMAIDLAPQSVEANGALAYYFEKTGELEQAKVYYNKTLSLAPHRGEVLNNYGVFQCRLGQYAAAERYFLKAVKDFKYVHTAQAYENAGLCAAAMPDFAKAKYYFLKALTHDPKRQTALYELIQLCLKEQRAEEAQDVLKMHQALVRKNLSLLNLALHVSQKVGDTAAELNYKHELTLRKSRLKHNQVLLQQ